MSPERRRSAGRLLVGSVVAGAVVAALATATSVGRCRALGGVDANECLGLVRTLSINVGVLTAIATAVMALFVVGVGRLNRQTEDDRRERRREALERE